VQFFLEKTVLLGYKKQAFLMAEIEKKYFGITEVSAQVDLSASLIRFWESIFDQIRPRKNKKGVRQYTKEDILLIKQIKYLVKEKGYTLQGAKEALKNEIKTSSKKDELIHTLKEAKLFLEKIKEAISTQ